MKVQEPPEKGLGPLPRPSKSRGSAHWHCPTRVSMRPRELGAPALVLGLSREGCLVVEAQAESRER